MRKFSFGAGLTNTHSAHYLLCGASLFLSIFLVSVCMCSCARKSNVTLIRLMTSDKEFAQYTELFNATHKDIKVALIYKDNPASQIPVPSSEVQPDIIAGKWLMSENAHKYFKDLKNIFNTNFNENLFYPALLEAGKYKKKQVLLPLSFNLPAVILSTENRNAVADGYTISVENIRVISREFTEKKQNSEQFAKIGFTLLDNSDFMYLASKIMHSDFRRSRQSVTWNDENFGRAKNYLYDWLNNDNGGEEAEKDFSYKYLSMPNYKRVNSGNCFFAYIKSDKLFSLAHEQIDYRWISTDGKLPVEDDIEMIGINAKSKHEAEARTFIKWLLNIQTQRTIIEDKMSHALDTDTFGIAGGFSSIIEVNEQVMPVLYTMLMSNIPDANSIEAPLPLPAAWDTIRERLVIPSLVQAVTTGQAQSLAERLATWERQNFN